MFLASEKIGCNLCKLLSAPSKNVSAITQTVQYIVYIYIYKMCVCVCVVQQEMGFRSMCYSSSIEMCHATKFTHTHQMKTSGKVNAFLTYLPAGQL